LVGMRIARYASCVEEVGRCPDRDVPNGKGIAAIVVSGKRANERMNVMRKMMVAGLAVASLFVAASAMADGDSLGAQGQIAISSDLQLSFTSSKDKPPQGDAGDATTTIVVQPALDYFVMDNLSIGGWVGYASSSQGDAKNSAFGLGPRVGYSIPITETIAFWPKLGVGYYSVSMDSGQPDSSSVSGNKMTLEVFAPVAISPAPHFFIGIGPAFQTDLSSKVEGNDANKNTTFGVVTRVGGYF